MFQAIKEVFVKPPVSKLMKNELEDARRSLLEALTAREYAEALVSYHTARVARLDAALKGLTE